MPAIEIENLTKRYGDVQAMDKISFSVEKGEIFGILGPNGAGKTTTVESIAGLRRPDGGTIRVLGLDPLHDQEEIRRRLGVQLQESRMPDRIKVGEALDLYASFYESPLPWEALLEQLDLTDKADTRFGKLSGRPEAARIDRTGPGRQPRGGDPRRVDHRPRSSGPS